MAPGPRRPPPPVRPPFALTPSPSSPSSPPSLPPLRSPAPPAPPRTRRPSPFESHQRRRRLSGPLLPRRRRGPAQHRAARLGLDLARAVRAQLVIVAAALVFGPVPVSGEAPAGLEARAVPAHAAPRALRGGREDQRPLPRPPQEEGVVVAPLPGRPGQRARFPRRGGGARVRPGARLGLRVGQGAPAGRDLLLRELQPDDPAEPQGRADGDGGRRRDAPLPGERGGAPGIAGLLRVLQGAGGAGREEGRRRGGGGGVGSRGKRGRRRRRWRRGRRRRREPLGLLPRAAAARRLLRLLRHRALSLLGLAPPARLLRRAGARRPGGAARPPQGGRTLDVFALLLRGRAVGRRCDLGALLGARQRGLLRGGRARDLPSHGRRGQRRAGGGGQLREDG